MFRKRQKFKIFYLSNYPKRKPKSLLPKVSLLLFLNSLLICTYAEKIISRKIPIIFYDNAAPIFNFQNESEFVQQRPNPKIPNSLHRWYTFPSLDFKLKLQSQELEKSRQTSPLTTPTSFAFSPENIMTSTIADLTVAAFGGGPPPSSPPTASEKLRILRSKKKFKSQPVDFNLNSPVQTGPPAPTTTGADNIVKSSTSETPIKLQFEIPYNSPTYPKYSIFEQTNYKVEDKSPEPSPTDTFRRKVKNVVTADLISGNRPTKAPFHFTTTIPPPPTTTQPPTTTILLPLAPPPFRNTPMDIRTKTRHREGKRVTSPHNYSFAPTQSPISIAHNESDLSKDDIKDFRALHSSFGSKKQRLRYTTEQTPTIITTTTKPPIITREIPILQNTGSSTENKKKEDNEDDLPFYRESGGIFDRRTPDPDNGVDLEPIVKYAPRGSQRPEPPPRSKPPIDYVPSVSYRPSNNEEPKSKLNAAPLTHAPRSIPPADYDEDDERYDKPAPKPPPRGQNSQYDSYNRHQQPATTEKVVHFHDPPPQRSDPASDSFYGDPRPPPPPPPPKKTYTQEQNEEEEGPEEEEEEEEEDRRKQKKSKRPKKVEEQEEEDEEEEAEEEEEEEPRRKPERDRESEDDRRPHYDRPITQREREPPRNPGYAPNKNPGYDTARDGPPRNPGYEPKRHGPPRNPAYEPYRPPPQSPPPPYRNPPKQGGFDAPFSQNNNFPPPPQPHHTNFPPPPHQPNHNFRSPPQTHHNNFQSPPQPRHKNFQSPPQLHLNNFQSPPEPRHNNFQSPPPSHRNNFQSRPQEHRHYGPPSLNYGPHRVGEPRQQRKPPALDPIYTMSIREYDQGLRNRDTPSPQNNRPYPPTPPIQPIVHDPDHAFPPEYEHGPAKPKTPKYPPEDDQPIGFGNPNQSNRNHNPRNNRPNPPRQNDFQPHHYKFNPEDSNRDYGSRPKPRDFEHDTLNRPGGYEDFGPETINPPEYGYDPDINPKPRTPQYDSEDRDKPRESEYGYEREKQKPRDYEYEDRRNDKERELPPSRDTGDYKNYERDDSSNRRPDYRTFGQDEEEARPPPRESNSKSRDYGFDEFVPASHGKGDYDDFEEERPPPSSPRRQKSRDPEEEEEERDEPPPPRKQQHHRKNEDEEEEEEPEEEDRKKRRRHENPKDAEDEEEGEEEDEEGAEGKQGKSKKPPPEKPKSEQAGDLDDDINGIESEFGFFAPQSRVQTPPSQNQGLHHEPGFNNQHNNNNNGGGGGLLDLGFNNNGFNNPNLNFNGGGGGIPNFYHGAGSILKEQKDQPPKI